MIITEKNNGLDIVFKGEQSAEARLWKDINGTHFQVGNEVIGDTVNTEKVEDYLYNITIDKVDEKYAYEKIPSIDITRACSSMRVGNFCGRNYDWNYDEKVTWCINTPANESRHASISNSSTSLTKAMVEKGQYNDLYKMIPFETLDGINDCHVYCNTNMVPAGEYGATTGTNPSGKDLYNLFIPKFVLDNATSARNAVDLLMTRNIKAIKMQGRTLELHFMVCDQTSSYVVEFVDNKVVVFSDQDDEFLNFPNGVCLFTNFYLYGWNGDIKAVFLGDSVEETKATGLTPHAEGLERYMILKDASANISSEADMINAMKSVYFTQSYDKTKNPFWYSEFLGGSHNIYTSADDFTDVVDYYVSLFENRQRDGQTWQTVHTAVYDLENLTMKIISQEGTVEHEYTLN